MARPYGIDLRRRMVNAIEDGMSTRAAARRFAIGESTAGAWHRRWRETGSHKPGRQGNQGGSRLNACEDFLIALMGADDKDITLTELAEALE